MIVWGIVLAAVAAFVLSSVFYSLAPAGHLQGLSTRPRIWQAALELVRSAIVAGLVAALMAAAGWSGAGAGALLGLALSVLPIVLLSGSVQWENVPIPRAAIHAIDWVLKLTAVGALVGLFR